MTAMTAIKNIWWFLWLIIDTKKCLLETTTKKERAETGIVLGD